MATSSHDRIKQENEESTHSLNQILCILRERYRRYCLDERDAKAAGDLDQELTSRIHREYTERLIQAATQLLIAF